MSANQCPTCGKPESEFEPPKKYLPFCSARCKNADLGKWLDGHYSTSRPLSDAEVWGLAESSNDDD